MSEVVEDPFLAQLTIEARSLLGFCWMLTGDRQRADDLFQDACLEAWRHQGRFDGTRPFGPWVRGIARNVVRRQARRDGRERSIPFDPEVIDSLVEAWDTEGDGDASERLTALRACLDGLEPAHREVLGQRYEQDRSLAEIGVASGRSTDAVKMLVMRLKRRLRDCVERRLAPRVVTSKETESEDRAP